MDIAGINECCGSAPGAGASHHDSLILWQMFALSPLLRLKGGVFIGLSDLRFGGPPRSSMLAIANGLALDIERVHMGKQRDAAQDAKHYNSHKNESCNIVHRTTRFPGFCITPFQSDFHCCIAIDEDSFWHDDSLLCISSCSRST